MPNSHVMEQALTQIKKAFEPYYEFFNEFGTHWMSYIQMGARYGLAACRHAPFAGGEPRASCAALRAGSLSASAREGVSGRSRRTAASLVASNGQA